LSYEQHAFISYAHLDNEPLTPGQKGWVTQFHATLQTRLSQWLGEKARIWRDDKLEGNDIFDAKILDQFAKTAVLISVLSPRYVKSEWCARELKAFCDAAERSGGLAVGDKSRVVKVVKTPVDGSAVLPPVAQRTLGYDFYELAGDEPKELDPALGDKAREHFLDKVSSLAWHLAKSLQQLAAADAEAEAARQAAAAPAPAGAAATPASAGAAAAPAKATVFLAECGRDLRDVREQLATDLRMHGHEVLPAQALPQDEASLRTELQAQLARSALAVHLVGRSAGPTPDGPSEQPMVVLQNELAAACSRQGPRGALGSLRRILWLPDGVQGERPEQQAFIDALQADAGLQFGADLLRGDVVGLKSAVHASLQRLAAEAAVPATPAPAGGGPVVHLLMTEADRLAAVPLVRLLRARGASVTLPAFKGDAASLRTDNDQRLAACDALLLFYGAGDEDWKFHQQTELRKHPAADRPGRAPRSDWLLLAGPATDDKRLQQALAEPGVIDALDRLDDATLAPLWAALPGIGAAPPPAAGAGTAGAAA